MRAATLHLAGVSSDPEPVPVPTLQSSHTCCGTRRPTCDWEKKRRYTHKPLFNTQGAHILLKQYNYTQKKVMCFVLPGAHAEQPHPRSAPPQPGSEVGSWAGWPLLPLPSSKPGPWQTEVRDLLIFSISCLPSVCHYCASVLQGAPLFYLFSVCFGSHFICCLLSRKQIAQPTPSLSPDWCFLLRPGV